MGMTIRVWPDSPLHILEFDNSYMRENTNGFNLNPPQNSDNHKVIDYSMSWKKTGELERLILTPLIDPMALIIDFGMLPNLIFMPQPSYPSQRARSARCSTLILVTWRAEMIISLLQPSRPMTALR